MSSSVPPRVLVLGAGGMLGHMLYRYIADRGSIKVLGTVRSTTAETLSQGVYARLVTGVRVEDIGRIEGIIDSFRPDLVVNCIAAGTEADMKVATAINSLFPHQLAASVMRLGARLVHVSTDGVFTGNAGSYSEIDDPDATDIYGRSKLLGEVTEPNSLTLRTSIIGPEIGMGRGLFSWISRQKGVVKGFRNVKFSGLTTLELSRIITEYILPRPDLVGLLNISSVTISKFELLTLIAKSYHLPVEVVPEDKPVIDRSLDSTRFKSLTGYEPPNWSTLIMQMRDYS
jgi:dTDP-4-dehydrorhamnose reductase